MMKKIIFNIAVGILIVSNSYAQEKEGVVIGTENITVPFTQSISIQEGAETEWKIISPNGTPVSGKGVLEKFKFISPGKYKIHIDNTQVKHEHDDECNHGEPTRGIEVNVSPYNMYFDFSSIHFSEKVKAGSNALTVSVNVVLASFDNNEVAFSDTEVRSAGVGATLIGKLISGEKLKPGVNKLTFQLSGETVKNSYIMFDFKDINGVIQSYSYPEMIK